MSLVSVRTQKGCFALLEHQIFQLFSSPLLANQRLFPLFPYIDFYRASLICFRRPARSCRFLHHSTYISLVVLACMHARLMWLNTIALGLLPVTVAESSTAPQLALPPEILAIVLKDDLVSISSLCERCESESSSPALFLENAKAGHGGEQTGRLPVHTLPPSAIFCQSSGV